MEGITVNNNNTAADYNYGKQMFYCVLLDI